MCRGVFAAAARRLARIDPADVFRAWSMGAGNRRYEGGGQGPEVAENLLAERFAHGEIDESEYTARPNVLCQGRRA